MGGSVKGAVLCGGEGVRLRPLTYYFQKTMIPVGCRQKPLIEYVVRLLKYHGVEDIVLLVNYKAEQIMNYLENGSRFGVKLEYVWDEPGMKGNGGALYNAYAKGYFDGYENVLVYYGDILTDLDIRGLINHHRKTGAVATIALSRYYTVSVGVAEVDGEKVVSLTEKPPLNKPVVIGILVLKSAALDALGEVVNEKGEADIMRDLIPLLISRKYHVAAFLTDAFWYDVGSTERYEKLDPKVVDERLGFLLG